MSQSHIILSYLFTTVTYIERKNVVLRLGAQGAIFSLNQQRSKISFNYFLICKTDVVFLQSKLENIQKSGNNSQLKKYVKRIVNLYDSLNFPIPLKAILNGQLPILSKQKMRKSSLSSMIRYFFVRSCRVYQCLLLLLFEQTEKISSYKVMMLQIKTTFVMNRKYIQFISAVMEFQCHLVLEETLNFDPKKTQEPSNLDRKQNFCVSQNVQFYICCIQSITSQNYQWVREYSILKKARYHAHCG